MPRRRDPGRLACTGRRLQHGGAAVTYRSHEIGEYGIHGEIGQRHLLSLLRAGMVARRGALTVRVTPRRMLRSNRPESR